MLSLSKEIVPQVLKQSITDLPLLKSVPTEPETLEILEFQSGEGLEFLSGNVISQLSLFFIDTT